MDSDVKLDDSEGSKEHFNCLRNRLDNRLSAFPMQTIPEIEDRIRNLFPTQLAESAIKHAQSKLKNHHHQHGHHHSAPATVLSQIGHRFQSVLMKDTAKTDDPVASFKMYVLDFVMEEILRLACSYVKYMGRNIILPNDIEVAMHVSNDLVDLFSGDHDPSANINNNNIGLCSDLCNDSSVSRQDRTYSSVVKEMDHSEKTYMRDLKITIRLFRHKLFNLQCDREAVNKIFANLLEIQELSNSLINALEDAIDRAENDPSQLPFIGSSMFELAEDANFDVYATYAESIVPKGSSNHFACIFSDDDIRQMIGSKDHLLDVAVKHFVPRLLLGPVYQCFEYFNFINELHELSSQHGNEDDRLALNETLSILLNLRSRLKHILSTHKINVETYAKNSRTNRTFSQIEAVKVTLVTTLDAMLEEDENALLLLIPDRYRFSEPDNPSNIIYDDSETDPPQIRSATVVKLIEKMTHHKYSATLLVRTFLTTYRSFINHPEELLDLLIERFRIPEPKITDVYPDMHEFPPETHPAINAAFQETIERFHNYYTNPVKMKVINVLKSWVLNHYYDFERNPSLMDKLQRFLSEDQGAHFRLKRFLNAITRIIEKKKQKKEEKKKIEFYNQPPPPFEWHTASPNEPEKFDILTLHPLELARQLTLIEFELFRAITPSELIDSKELDPSKPLTAEEKNRMSPNLTKLTNHTNKIGYWIQLCIVQAEDFNHRVAVVIRAIEIMHALNELNNFAGLLTVGSALFSASVRRLVWTFKAIKKTSKQHINWLDDYQSLTDNHMKGLQARLKRANPPCIPFIGSYQTKLLFAKEGNSTFADMGGDTPIRGGSDAERSEDGSSSAPVSPMTKTTSNFSASQFSMSPSSSAFLNRPDMGHSFRGRISLNGFDGALSTNNSNNCSFSVNGSISGTLAPQARLINFAKQRIRADLVAEICQYQNQPYCFAVQPEIRRFIESINVSIPTEDDEESGFKSLVQRPSYTNEKDFFNALEDYLYEKSRKIESKETKPQRSQKRDLSWKSPGIRPRSARSRPTALPGPSSEVSPNTLHSPSTPLTPQTPPLSGGSAVSSEHSVFDDLVPPPPPLPPRRPIGSDSGSSSMQIPPPLPPRTN